MTDRKEPTISKYQPPPDERARGKGQASQTASVEASPSHIVHHRKPSGGGTGIAVVALVIAIASVGFATYMYSQLFLAQSLLKQADLRIADLEGKFEMSDDEVSASTETMQAKLKWADSEIRKLWGVSYDTNRKDIAENKENIVKAVKASTEAKKAVKDSVASITGDVQLVSELVDAQQSAFVTIESQNKQLIQRLENLDKKLDALEKNVKKNDQAIEAIDAFRKNVNQQLLQLRGS